MKRIIKSLIFILLSLMYFMIMDIDFTNYIAIFCLIVPWSLIIIFDIYIVFFKNKK